MGARGEQTSAENGIPPRPAIQPAIRTAAIESWGPILAAPLFGLQPGVLGRG
jgi:hypothetical protein